MNPKPAGVMRAFVLAILAMLLGSRPSRAQSFAIDWHSVDGGGGTSTGGLFSVSGTIGQPDAAPSMAGGSFSLAGGFWSVVQTPGAPLLNILLTGNRAVV